MNGLTRWTSLLALALPLAVHADTLTIATDADLVNHFPGPDGLIGTNDDVVSAAASSVQGSEPNTVGSTGYNAFQFSSQADASMPTGTNAITFVRGTVTIDEDVAANGGGALVTGLEIASGTEPFPGHGAYTSRITEVNSGSYNPATGAFEIDADFAYTILGVTQPEPNVALSGQAFYREAADYGTPTGNSYMDSVAIPLAQAAGSDSVLFVEAEGALTNLGYPIRQALVALGGNGFLINPGLNDAWFYEPTAGQGFFVNVFPVGGTMFVSWFTYDTERPPQDVTAVLGEPGHRWLTAQGPFSGDTATLSVYLTEGGVFDSAQPPATTDPTPIGTITITWSDCDTAELEYAFLGLTGTIPIERVSKDNVVLCEAFLSEDPPVR